MYNIKIYYIGFLSFFSTLVRSLQHFWMAALLWHSVSRIDSGLLMWHHCQRCSNATRPGFPCNNHGWKWESVSSSMRMTCFIQMFSNVERFVYLFVLLDEVRRCQSLRVIFLLLTMGVPPQWNRQGPTTNLLLFCLSRGKFQFAKIDSRMQVIS